MINPYYFIYLRSYQIPSALFFDPLAFVKYCHLFGNDLIRVAITEFTFNAKPTKDQKSRNMRKRIFRNVRQMKI